MNSEVRGTSSKQTSSKDRDMHQYIWEVIQNIFFSLFHRCKRGHNTAQPTEWDNVDMSIVVKAFRYPTGVVGKGRERIVPIFLASQM